jgi:hypothetical protein
LAFCIDFIRLEIASCLYCESYKKKYIVEPDSGWYSEYICLKYKYNIKSPSTSNWQAINIFKEYLEQETEETAQTIVAVAAKLVYLQKQQQLLYTCIQDILKYSLKILDKLDKAEAKEKEEKEVQEYTIINSFVLANLVWLESLSEEQL